jgi:heat shock protein HslJ
MVNVCSNLGANLYLCAKRNKFHENLIPKKIITMKKSQIAALVLMVAVTLGACCSCRNAAKNHKPFVSTLWTLEQMGGENVIAQLPAGEQLPALTFAEDGSFGGYAGCNRLGGQYQLKPNEEAAKDGAVTGTLALLNPFTTKRMCPNDQIEMAFLAALGTVDSYTIEGDKLFLLSNGELKLVFVASTPRE